MIDIASLVKRARRKASRVALTSLAGSAPWAVGRWGTHKFLETRPRGTAAPPGAPAGAAVIRLSSDERVPELYVWGKSGPLVVLVHGWGADSGSMCGLVQPLRSRGYRVVAFDAPGHGSNRGSSTTMTHFVTALRRVLNEFEPSREIRALVGHSLGGLAAVAALDRPGRRPQRLVLVGAPSNLSQVLRTFTASWGLPIEIEQCIRSNLLVSHGVPIDHWDVRTLGVRNRLPTLVLHDRDDPYVPYTESETIARALGVSARVELTNSLGHVRILADERSTSLIAEFVADTGRHDTCS